MLLTKFCHLIVSFLCSNSIYCPLERLWMLAMLLGHKRAGLQPRQSSFCCPFRGEVFERHIILQHIHHLHLKCSHPYVFLQHFPFITRNNLLLFINQMLFIMSFYVFLLWFVCLFFTICCWCLKCFFIVFLFFMPLLMLVLCLYVSLAEEQLVQDRQLRIKDNLEKQDMVHCV